MKCENCGNEHNGKYGSGRFCSCKCARCFASKEKRSLINEKVSAKLKGKCFRTYPEAKYKCRDCGKRLQSFTKHDYCKLCLHSGRHDDIIHEMYKNCGGVRLGAGRGKAGWYKGVWCDSSYELAWVMYCLDNNIRFERNKVGFDYIYNGITKKYYPDFILEDGTYIEIKGYKSDEVDSKTCQFQYKLKVLYLADIYVMIAHAISVYGKNFISLYDGNPHNDRNRICLICGKPAKNMYCGRTCSGKAVNKNRYSDALIG